MTEEKKKICQEIVEDIANSVVVPESYQKAYCDWFFGKTDKPPSIADHFDVSKIPINDEPLVYVGHKWED